MISPLAPNLPFSQACENNKEVILEHLSELFADRTEVLELGSGTGQHATWFAGHMPWLRWGPTDIANNLSAGEARCGAYEGDNLLAMRALDVTLQPWNIEVPDAIYTANSLHIMPYSAVESLFSNLAETALAGTVLVVYGPFNYRGRHTSESNARFDLWLAEQHPQSAIRHFEQVNSLARNAGFSLQHDYAMPANNRLLVWRKSMP